MKTITINEELKLLLPPLSPDEYAGLERSILKDGVITPLIVWNDILVDGHHRYEICNKHQIPYAIKNVTLDSLEDAKLWAWQHQDGRRNLTPYHRAELALRFKDIYAAKAKERQIRKAAGFVAPNLAQQNDGTRTNEDLAQIAKVSHGTLNKVEYISKHADKETKDKLRNGEKGCSIHKEYSRLKAEQEPSTEKKTDDTTQTGDTTQTEQVEQPEEQQTEQPQDTNQAEQQDQPQFRPGSLPKKRYVGETQLKPIPRDRPDILVANLIAFFPEEFVPETAREIFRMLHDRYGKEVSQPLADEMYKKYGRRK